MEKLLLLADDFTGALDTGVQFAAKGLRTSVIADASYDFSRTDPHVQVMVVDTETRHMEAREAYDVVYRTVKGGMQAGFRNIYKKTDSALRGNVGSELAAAYDASGAAVLSFIPAFPKMNRGTRQGIHYIDGVPVAQSVFGKDPFDPVTESDVTKIISAQTTVPVSSIAKGQEEYPAAGIRVFDADTDEDLALISQRLGETGMQLSAGCAGFARFLAEYMVPSGETLESVSVPEFFVACGSVNPVTLAQMKYAEGCGFTHIHLKPVQKLEPQWLDTAECDECVAQWLKQAKSGRFILDVNDPEGCTDTADYAHEKGYTVSDMRVRIAAQVGGIMKKMLDGGLMATILCTGGDTLLATTSRLGISELVPIREVAPGSVLMEITYQGRKYPIISKSGGFGVKELFGQLADELQA